MSTLHLSDSVSKLSGVGTMRAAQLGELGIETIKDLLYYAPFRYETVEREVTIANLQPETTVCIHAQVISKIPIKTARFASMLKVTVADQTGKLDLTWFNNRFILSSLKVGEQYYFTGKVSAFKGKPTITNPSVERETPEFGSLVPVYHESADITSRFLRKLVKQALEQTYLADDPKMLDIYKKHKLIALKAALNTLHRPEAEGGVLKSARDRLA
ncbi:MAG TPA: OB-fold nucleic acid binding domain-containing protein, partial [Patescibacteria group bacterium]|nr:OB-fold nucleic acid binding domain-containing protein [Patescibacteria group bacterium]